MLRMRVVDHDVEDCGSCSVLRMRIVDHDVASKTADRVQCSGFANSPCSVLRMRIMGYIIHHYKIGVGDYGG